MSVHRGRNHLSLSWKNGVMGTGKDVFFVYVLFCFLHVFIHSHLAWPQVKNSVFSILVVISFHFCAYISSETKEKKKRKRNEEGNWHQQTLPKDNHGLPLWGWLIPLFSFLCRRHWGSGFFLHLTNASSWNFYTHQDKAAGRQQVPWTVVLFCYCWWLTGSCPQLE